MKKICILSIIISLILTGCSGEILGDRFASGFSQIPASETEQEETSSEETEEQSKEASSNLFSNNEEEADVSADAGSRKAQETGSSSKILDEITVILDEIVTPSMSEYEKVKSIHDYLVIHVDYDYDNLAAETLPDTAFTAEGALLLHSAVCEGYAKAFSLLCDQSGLENTLVYGTADDGTGVQTHAWNQVRVDGEWYNIDVTWDDPLMNGERVTDGSNLIYDYFLVPDLTLLGNHTANSGSELHSCTSERYLEENRRLTIAPYLQEPCTFATTDEEVQAAIDQYFDDDIRIFQIICDVTYCSPEGRAELILNYVKAAMETRMESGQISVGTKYGIADYAIIDVSITP